MSKRSEGWKILEQAPDDLGRCAAWRRLWRLGNLLIEEETPKEAKNFETRQKDSKDSSRPDDLQALS